MFLKQLDLTTALRPSYLPDEDLLFLQDNVGLYEGKYKLPDQQNGQVYLTSHRICYVDKDEPRKNSVSLDLKDVDRSEFYAGFLKSSPKITLIPKPMKRSSLQSRVSAAANIPSRSGTTSPIRPDSPFRPPSEPPASAATWVCVICSFSNPVPSNFDPTTASVHTPLPPCLACGIKPTLAHMLKAAIANATSRSPGPAATTFGSPLPARPRRSDSRSLGGDLSMPSSPMQPTAIGSSVTPSADPSATFECPRCTFMNHPSLLACEICGAPLISRDLPGEYREQPRTESPGPMLNVPVGSDTAESVKISFRGGGEKIFYERLKGSMTQRKWLLHGAPPIPQSNKTIDGSGSIVRSPPGPEKVKSVGIAALEQRGLDLRKNNEIMIGSAFEDLEALMSRAKEIVALAERFALQTNGGSASTEANALLAETGSQLGLVTTKDIVAGGSSSESLYLSELSRNMAEFLTDDARGVLKRAGGIISLVDLWAMFNRARGGVELVSPLDFEKAARMWETLRLPVRLRTFKSGVMVVQARDRTDDTTIRALVTWLRDLHEFPPEREVPWDWHEFGRGVTAQDAASRFGWSIGVAEEELELAEEKGVLCREVGTEGLKFWINYLDTGEREVKKPSQAAEDERRIMKALRESGIM